MLSDEELDALQAQDEKDNGVSLCSVFAQAREANRLRAWAQSITLGPLDPFNAPESRIHRALSFASQHGYHETDAAFTELHGIRASNASLSAEVERLRTPFDLDLEANQAALDVYESDLLGLCNSTLFDGKVSERVCAALWERQERLRKKADLADWAESIIKLNWDPTLTGDNSKLPKEIADWLLSWKEANADV